MRFTIAVGILSQALPASSDPTNANILLGASDERKQRIQSLLQEPADRQSDLFSTLKKGRKPAGLSAVKNKKRRFKNGALKNEAIIPEDAVACDPSSTADVGLLSCGVGKYCVESQNSKLGGSCVSSMQLTTNRNLQYDNFADNYCNPNLDFYQTIPCDCAEFDLPTLTGSIECTYNYGCLEAYCNDTCFDLSIFYSKDEEGVDFRYCYNGYSPSEESFCIDYSYSLDGVATSCSASFNGEDCGPCELGPSMYYGDQCAYVNCTSVGGLAGNLCYDILFPILQECYDYDNYNNFCDICAGENVTDLFANVSIPEYGDFSCFALLFAGAFGEIPDSYCPAFQGSAAETCCAEFDPDIFVCQICGEGKAITKPDGAVLIPTQPVRTCAEIQAGAEAGDISTVQCPLISSFVNEPCGCEDVMPTEPPAPTDAPVVVPTDAPVVAPTPAPVVAPTPAPTDGGSGLLSVKNAASLVGLSMAMVFYFAG